jgi:anti-sigma B factor antagonist
MKTVNMATAGPVEDRPRDSQSLTHAGPSRLDKQEFVAGLPVRFPHSARGVPVVAAPEEIGFATAYGLRAALASAARGQATVVVDMTRTHACDTTGLHVLVRAHKRALAQGGELRLVISSPDVRRLLAITGLDRVIRHFASLDEALAQTSADPNQPPRPSDAA